MRAANQFCCALLAAACLATQAEAGQLGFTVTGGNTSGNGNTSFLGYEFTTTTAIAIDGLGILLPSASSTSYENHTVSLFASDKTTQLASTTVTVGSSRNNGNATINAIGPVTLGPGNYFIGAFYSAGDYTDLMYDSGTTFSSGTGISWVEAIDNYQASGANFSGPLFQSSNQVGYFGPDFTFTAVPEPATLGLSFLALTGLTAARRKRRRA